MFKIFDWVLKFTTLASTGFILVLKTGGGILSCSTSTYIQYESQQWKICDFSTVTNTYLYDEIIFCQTRLDTMEKECFNMEPTKSLAYLNQNWGTSGGGTHKTCNPLYQ